MSAANTLVWNREDGTHWRWILAQKPVTLAWVIVTGAVLSSHLVTMVGFDDPFKRPFPSLWGIFRIG
jgi:hypothetical protein